jgi:hypothetical protein
MVTSTTALWFSVGAALGGTLLGIVGTLASDWLSHRRELRRYWLDVKRDALVELLVAISSMGSVADVLIRQIETAGSTVLGGNLELQQQIFTANERLLTAIYSAQVITDDSPMDPVMRRIDDAHAGFVEWMRAGYQVVEGVAQSRPFLENMRVARNDLVNVTAKELGIRRRV